MSDLLPCPFCGGKAYMFRDYPPDVEGTFYACKCKDCGAQSKSHYARETCPIFFEGVRASWNTRILADAEALKAADALVEAIHNLADWQRYDSSASHFPAEKPEVHECTDDARNALEAALTAYRKARGGE